MLAIRNFIFQTKYKEDNEIRVNETQPFIEWVGDPAYMRMLPYSTVKVLWGMGSKCLLNLDDTAVLL